VQRQLCAALWERRTDGVKRFPTEVPGSELAARLFAIERGCVMGDA
jgi:hypothetical protein